ncbi:MAG TPA: hypothetical protein VJY66_02715 [Acholeplasma sp.]|nr:hypothetical protein [Acholeplasma sp.]
MLNKLKVDFMRSIESYLIYLGALIHFIFFLTFEFNNINVADPDMEVAGLTIVFRLIVVIIMLVLAGKLRDIAADNKGQAITLLLVGLFAIIPSAERISNMVPVLIWVSTAIYIIIKYKVLVKK